MDYPLRGSTKVTDTELTIKVQTSGTATYIGQAAPGTLQSSAKWQAFKYDSGVLTWAGGSPDFKWPATDLSLLDYS